MTSARVICDYCQREARLVKGQVVYPRSRDLHGLWYWHCAPCEAWVGCHKRGKGGAPGQHPLGRLANAELRRERQAAHAAFDPLWRSGAMGRRDAYRWLAGQLGVAVQNCHIGVFDVDGCRAVVAAVRARSAA